MVFDWTTRRILIVARDEQFRFFARGLFKHHRVREVQSVAHVTEIPRILARHEIHVAFVELTHEETGVAHMLQWLRTSRDSPAPKMPVILLAKSLDQAQLAQACVFGIHGVLQMPVSGEKMLSAVIGVTGNPKMFKPAGTPGAAADKGRKLPFTAPPLSSLRRDPVRPVVPPAGGRTPLSPRQASRPAGAAGKASFGPGKSGGGAIETTGAASIPAVRSPGSIEVAEPPAAGRKSPPPDIAEAAVTRSAAFEPAGPSLEAILEAHSRWVRGGGRDGRRADLEGRELCGLRLADAVLTSALLRRADLSGCDFTGAEMQGIDLRNANVPGGTFIGVNLAVARLRHARLRGCVFSGASLKGADLGGADLTEAKLGDADLAGAILLGACLSGADLSGVSGLAQGQLEGVLGDARTRLPPGLSLPPSRSETG